MYSEGSTAVQQNNKTAFEWFKKAADSVRTSTFHNQDSLQMDCAFHWINHHELSHLAGAVEGEGLVGLKLYHFFACLNFKAAE